MTTLRELREKIAVLETEKRNRLAYMAFDAEFKEEHLTGMRGDFLKRHLSALSADDTWLLCPPAYKLEAYSHLDVFHLVKFSTHESYFIRETDLETLRKALVAFWEQTQVEFEENTVEHLRRLAQETHNPRLQFREVKTKRYCYRNLLQGKPNYLIDSHIWWTRNKLERTLRVKAIPTKDGYLVVPNQDLLPARGPYVRLIDQDHWQEATWEDMSRWAAKRPDEQNVRFVLGQLQRYARHTPEYIEALQYTPRDVGRIKPDLAVELSKVNTAGEFISFLKSQGPEIFILGLKDVGDNRAAAALHFLGFDDALPDSMELLERHIDRVRQRHVRRIMNTRGEEEYDRLVRQALKDGLITSRDKDNEHDD